LRFYERRGLFAPATRSAGGYRLFTEADLRRLEFVRQAKALGLTLNEIQELMNATRERTCAMTRPLLLHVLDRRISDTSRQIKALSELRR
jgi:DNA-binding transcriptional MerR regulator